MFSLGITTFYPFSKLVQVIFCITSMKFLKSTMDQYGFPVVIRCYFLYF